MTYEELIDLYNKIGYINFHLHSDGSLLDGLCDIEHFVPRLKEILHQCSALTDHGSMANILDFYKRFKEEDIKLIMGLEAYVADARQLQNKSDFLLAEEVTGDDFIFSADKAHLILLAKNFKGYQNLCELSKRSNSEGFYAKPRIDFEILREHSEGLICVEGHVGTLVAKCFERAENPEGETEEEKQAYREKEIQRAYDFNEWYIDLFGDDYYLEIQNHGLRIEKQVTPHVMKLAKDTGVKLVMSNDSHYVNKEDAHVHRLHMANGIGKTYEEFMNSDFEGFSTCDEFYVKSNEEMLEVAQELGEEAIQALLNTHEIAEKCNVEIDALVHEEKDGKHSWKPKDYLFPNFDIPAPYSNAESYFEDLVWKGLDDRKDKRELDLEVHRMDEYKERLNYEMDVIKDMGFPTYFLVIWDVVRFCREKGIPVGKGRGSAAGSVVSYLLRITDVDPIQYGLIFERLRKAFVKLFELLRTPKAISATT